MSVARRIPCPLRKPSQPEHKATVHRAERWAKHGHYWSMPGAIAYVSCDVCDYDLTREQLKGRIPQNLETPVDSKLLAEALPHDHWQLKEPWRFTP